MRFKNRIVLITGASRGIGEGAALRFPREGANPVLIAKNEEGLYNISGDGFWSVRG